MSKSLSINLVCNVLANALPFVCQKDSRAFEIFNELPNNLIISIKVFGEGEYIKINKTKTQIVTEPKKSKLKPDLTIIFKNRKSAKLVLFGKLSVAQSFTRHDILLEGNINTAIALVNIINICEYYLFPRFLTYKFLPKMNKEFSSCSLYSHCLFGNSSKIKITKENYDKYKLKHKVKPKKERVKKEKKKHLSQIEKMELLNKEENQIEEGVEPLKQEGENNE